MIKIIIGCIIANFLMRWIDKGINAVIFSCENYQNQEENLDIRKSRLVNLAGNILDVETRIKAQNFINGCANEAALDVGRNRINQILGEQKATK
jgi:hypothetical protein